MKKVLILSIVAMFTAFSGFAATTASATWQSGDPNGSYVYDNSGSAPEITLSWDLSTSKVEFGFYTDDTLATPATGITIETEDSGTGIVGKGETYVGWKITGAAPVKLEIYASGALTGGTDTNKINWEGEFTGGEDGATPTAIGSTENDSNYTETNKKLVLNETETQTTTYRSDSTKITITTEDAADKAPDKYSATMTLVISAGDVTQG